MPRILTARMLAAAALLPLLAGPTTAQSAAQLAEDFANPPGSAKPRTWWHWTGSNVTLEGISRDLEWMARVGIGGMQLADVNFGGGQTVEEKTVFWSPEWMAAVRHAAAEADRLGLEMAMFSSAGWSLTGGPWVEPRQAMKKLVWSEVTVEGPSRFAERLPQPPTQNGIIRDLARGGEDPTFYGEAAVVAFRTPPSERPMAERHPEAWTNTGLLDATALVDDDLNSAVTIAAPPDGSAAWIQYVFEEPYEARALSLAGRGGIPHGRLLASDDGEDYRTLATFPGPQGYRGGSVRTFAFRATSARYFRIELTGAPFTPAGVMAHAPPEPAEEYVLGEAILHAGPRVHRWEDKAGYSFLFEYESTPTPRVAAEQTIALDRVVDLTSHMDEDGTLRWEVPAGRWTIMRLGYSLTGAKNRPPVPAGLGYEVDKLSREHTEAYFHHFADSIAAALGPLYGRSMQYMLLDSWEAGTQNWTDSMSVEFERRRGYDPTPYLPVIAGRVIGSAEISDRFLWDFRRTLVDMFAENHYRTATEFLNRQGVGTYSEASGVSLEPLEDALLNKKYVDIPMGEFWVRDLHPSAMYYEDVRGAASAAHVYGKPVVATESFTGGGYESPATLKNIADYWFAQGTNRIVFHTSAHQPLDTKPGNTMVGTHIHRNITWAEQARPFMTYLARNSYMLQQGLFVADLLYLLNEGAPSTMPFWGAGLRPEPPEGYDYDYTNADALLTRVSVAEDGRLVLPDGMSYRVLVLPPIDRMTLPVLRKVAELVASGATVVGPRPAASPGLSGYPDADAELRELAAQLWGDLDGVSRARRPYGDGTVVWGLPLDEVLSSLDVEPDVEHDAPADADIAWIHRRLPEADIYFLANTTDQPRAIDVRFRVSGRAAELWHAGSGEIDQASYRTDDTGTTVPLRLGPHESRFVVFRGAVAAPSRELPRPVETVLTTLEGAWTVTFPSDLGAPERVELPALESWTEHADEGVRFFSGTATYGRELQVPRAWLRDGTRLVLDLGDVADVAEVVVDGEPVEIAWKAPFRVDLTDVIDPGTHRLEVRVTNQWTNRIAGDRLGPPESRVLAGPPGRGFGPPPQPAESGLLGPVRIVAVTTP